MSNWYAIFTHARAEQKAQFNLERQGFQSFFPKYRKRRRHARRVETVSSPLFPRYVFVRLDLDRQPWRSINSTLGVHGIVCQGEKPAPLPEGIVEELISRQDELGCVGLSGNTSIARGTACGDHRRSICRLRRYRRSVAGRGQAGRTARSPGASGQGTSSSPRGYRRGLNVTCWAHSG